MIELSPRLRRIALWLLVPSVALIFYALGGAGRGDGGECGDEASAEHAGMEGNDDPHAGHDDAAAEVWTCAMHPSIRMTEPGQCPICGMDLIRVQNESRGAAGDDEGNRIVLSERSKALARIRTTRVQRATGGGITRHLLGRIEHDETTLRTVTSWIGGRIDRLRIRVTGEKVRRGQIIATLYSPEIYSAHQDLLEAKRQVGRLGDASETAVRSAAAALGAVRSRLSLLGVPETEISRMERASAPRRQVSIRSPFAGTVMERLTTEGSYVTTGAGLYRLADLSRLWVQLDAYESDLALMNVGQAVSLRVEAYPGEVFEGRIAFIDPILDPRRRTAEIRVELENPGERLKPGMFARATVEAGASPAGAAPLMVPATAPLFTGRRSIVYVELANTDRPTYEARPVRLGPRMGDSFPVLAGLRDGENVVVQGAFAIDADLQIQGGASMMVWPDDNEHGPYDAIVPTAGAAHDALEGVVRAYLGIQESLAADDLDGAREAVQTLMTTMDVVDSALDVRGRAAWQPIAENLRAHGQHTSGASDLDGARSGFNALSAELERLLTAFGNPLEETLAVQHCPMAFDNAGANWVQRGDDVQNPYFGPTMSTCGSVESTIEPGDFIVGHGVPQAGAPAGGHQH